MIAQVGVYWCKSYSWEEVCGYGCKGKIKMTLSIMTKQDKMDLGMAWSTWGGKFTLKECISSERSLRIRCQVQKGSNIIYDVPWLVWNLRQPDQRPIRYSVDNQQQTGRWGEWACIFASRVIFGVQATTIHWSVSTIIVVNKRKQTISSSWRWTDTGNGAGWLLDGAACTRRGPGCHASWLE